MRTSLTLLALTLACGAEEAPEEPATEAPPETPPEPERTPPPEVTELGGVDEGESRLAWPTWESPAYAFPREELEAGFGAGEGVVLLRLGPADVEGDEHAVQLVFRGALAPGEHEAKSERHAAGEDGVFGTSLPGSDFLVRSGSVTVETTTDERLQGTLDLEVATMLNPEPTRIRARFDAKREPFYDAQLTHQRAIREQMRQR